MDQIEEIKSKVNIEQLVGQYVVLKKAGRNFKGLCPFHGEKTPSFMVNPELGIYKCFGCGEGGDAFTFLQKIEGMDFSEALSNLAAKVGVVLTSYKPTQGEQLREKIISINSLTASVYHYMLLEHKLGISALKYVQERGITDESIKKFKLGFAPNSWDFLYKFLTIKKKYLPADLQKTGLVVEGKRYDRFRNRIIFPLANPRGQVVGFAGRILPEQESRRAGEQAKYVNTPETEVYHKGELLYGFDVTRAEIKSTETCVVVEGEIDMIASWQAGVKNVVAIKGSALTEKQVELLSRICDTIILGLDADLAGDKAARRGIEIAQKRGMVVKIVSFDGKYKDPGEMAIVDANLWKEAVAKAIGIYDFYISSAVKRYDMSSQGKVRIVRELVPILSEIDDEIMKSTYIQKLSEAIDVRDEDIRAQMVKIPNPKSQVPRLRQGFVGQANPKSQIPRREILEEYVIELALKGGKVDQLISLPVNQLLKTDFWKRVAQELDKDSDPRKLPEELRERTQTLLLKEGEFREKEWETALRELEEVNIHEKIQDSKLKDQEVLELTRRLGELTKGK